MWIKVWLLLLAGIAGFSGCAEEAPPPVAADRVETIQPMPALADRIERVLGELGDDAASVRDALRLERGLLVLPRREALAAIGPHARATLQRHNVRIEQLARALERGEP
jgi:hypothetical protein